MALTLSLDFEEQNDAKAIIATDTTGLTDSTDWGVGTNPSYTDIDNASYGLYLDIIITDSSGTSTTYDQIDLYDEFGPFVNYEDLIFVINCANLKEGGVSIGAIEDEVPDGIWNITYTISEIGVSNTSNTFDVLFRGAVEKDFFYKLSKMSTNYDCNDGIQKKELLDIGFEIASYIGLKSSAYIARTDSLLRKLKSLERMLQNGTNNTW